MVSARVKKRALSDGCAAYASRDTIGKEGIMAALCI